MFEFFKKTKQEEPVKVEEPKKTNVIDYTYSSWGNSLYVNKERKTADGFYPKLYGGKPDEGTIVFKADGKNKKVWIARLHNVKWYDNPDDAYFCEYTTITDTAELTEEEIKELNRKLMFLHGFDLNSGSKE